MSACLVNSLCRNRRSRKVLNPNRSWKTIQLRLHVTLKTGVFLPFLKGTVTWQGAGLLVLQFCFSAQNQRTLLTFLASISMQLLWWWIAGVKTQLFFLHAVVHFLFLFFTKGYDFCSCWQQTIKKGTFWQTFAFFYLMPDVCWANAMLWYWLMHNIY